MIGAREIGVRIFLAALALVLAPAAAEATDGSIPSAFEPAVLQRMCSPEGTMQFTFGQAGVPGSSKIEATLGQGFGLPADLAPFKVAQPRATEWSGLLMQMTYKAAMPKESATPYTAQLAAMLAAAGWTPADMEPGQQPLYLMGYGGGRTFTKPSVHGTLTTRVLAHLEYDEGAVLLLCGRDDLLKQHAREAFGELPPGTPRPHVPDIPLPPVQLPADCQDPAKLAAVNAALQDRSATSYTGMMLARTSWRDRLTAWMVWKLESSGKISKDRMLPLLLRSASSGSPGGDPLAALRMLPELFDVASKLSTAEKAGDQRAMCLAVVEFRAFMAKADAITLSQTAATQAALTAEAARLGVPFD